MTKGAKARNRTAGATITNNASAMNGGMLNLETEGEIHHPTMNSVRWTASIIFSVRGNGEVFFNNNVRGVNNFVIRQLVPDTGGRRDLYVRNYTAGGTPG